MWEVLRAQGARGMASPCVEVTWRRSSEQDVSVAEGRRTTRRSHSAPADGVAPPALPTSQGSPPSSPPPSVAAPRRFGNGPERFGSGRRPLVRRPHPLVTHGHPERFRRAKPSRNLCAILPRATRSREPHGRAIFSGFLREGPLPKHSGAQTKAICRQSRARMRRPRRLRSA